MADDLLISLPLSSPSSFLLSLLLSLAVCFCLLFLVHQALPNPHSFSIIRKNTRYSKYWHCNIEQSQILQLCHSHYLQPLSSRVSAHTAQQSADLTALVARKYSIRSDIEACTGIAVIDKSSTRHISILIDQEEEELLYTQYGAVSKRSAAGRRHTCGTRSIIRDQRDCEKLH